MATKSFDAEHRPCKNQLAIANNNSVLNLLKQWDCSDFLTGDEDKGSVTPSLLLTLRTQLEQKASESALPDSQTFILQVFHIQVFHIQPIHLDKQSCQFVVCI
jgi:hypothetical protein